MVATIISLYLNKPLSDIDSFINGRLLGSGTSKNHRGWVKDFSEIKKILVVEDSVASGRSIMEAKQKLQNAGVIPKRVYFAAYVEEERKHLVDVYAKVVPQPRMFEWNYLHHYFLDKCCVDIDGVLCDDPTEAENDDGENYIRFVENARPKLIPTERVGCIVSSRLERYRFNTEAWIRKHGIGFGQLFLMNLQTAEERRRLGNHAEFKAEIYASLADTFLFIESDDVQAKKINALTGKAVFCTGSQIFYRQIRI